MIYILDKNLDVVESLSNEGALEKITPFFDDTYTQLLSSGAETYNFSTLANSNASKYLVVGNYVAFKYQNDYKLFHITEVRELHAEDFIKTVYCETAGIELINEIVRPVELTGVTARQVLEKILETTEWQVGTMDASLIDTSDVSIEEYSSVYSCIQEYIINNYGAEVSFSVKLNKGRITHKLVNVYKNRGRSKGVVFSYSSNITSVSKNVNASEVYTAMIGCGKDGVTFKELVAEDKPAGLDYVVDEEALKRWGRNGNHILGVFEADTDKPEKLLALTRKALSKYNNPKITYELSVEMLDENVSIGDTVRVVDHEFNPPLYLEARVSELNISFSDSTQDSCVLSNFVELTSNITSEMKKLASTLKGYVNNTVESRFPIQEEDIDDEAVHGNHIYKNSISTEHLSAELIEAVEGKFDKITVDVGNFKELIATKAEIEDLEATIIRVEDLEANSATIEDLTATKAEIEEAIITKAEITDAKIENLKANKAEIEDLRAATAEIGQLKADTAHIGQLTADVGKIQNLVSGNISSGNIQTGGITGDNLNMDTIFVRDANILDLSASKLTAGEINTSKIAITSEDGGILLVGNTQQFLDENGNVRIQLGRDAKGNFDFFILDDEGEILFNPSGITGNAIANGLIKNDMIGTGQIGGDKINWQSFATEFNKETNTTTLNSSKIMLDGTNQSLNVHFNKIENTVEGIQEELKVAKEPYIKRVCIYYGYPNAINGSWNISNSVNIYKNYDIVVFGDNYNQRDHEAYADTLEIIKRLRVEKPELEIFGYVPCSVSGGTKDLSTEEIKALIDAWSEMGVTGIFYDEFGYDYGNTRERQNELVLHGKSHGLNAFVNSWEDQYVFSSLPMTISWMPNFYPNPNGLAPVLDENDYSLYEHLFFECYTGIQKASNPWRVYKAYDYYNKEQSEYGMTYYEKFGTRTISLDGIHSSIPLEQRKELMSISLIGSKILNVDGVGFGDERWGSTGKFYEWALPEEYDLKEDGKHKTTSEFNGYPRGFGATVNGNELKLTWDNGIAEEVTLDKGNRSVAINDEIVEDAWITVKDIVKTHTTQLNVQQGKIDTLIQDTTIVKDGVSTTLKDAYNKTVATVNSLSSTIGNQETVINELTGEVEVATTKVNNLTRDLNETQLLLQSTTTTANNTSSQVSEIKQNYNQISSRLESIEDFKTDTQKTLNTQSSQINQLADSIELKVSQSHFNEVKNELVDSINNKAEASNVYTKAETNSQISAAKDAINLSVSEKYETKENVTTKINTAVSTIQLGGRNLAVGTSDTYISNSSFSGIANDCKFPYKVWNKGLSVGDKVTVSCKFKYENLATSNTSSNAIRIQGSGDVTAWNSGSFNSYSIPITFGETVEKNIVYTFAINENHLKNNYWSINFRTDHITSGKIYVKEFQVEKGEKQSAWTQAPEDIHNAINDKANSNDVYKKTETYTKEETNSKINIAKEEINLGVKNTYETKTNVESKISSANTTTLNSAKSYADTKKTEAINSASTDATNKVNSAKNELNTKIDNIQVGGRNLIRKADLGQNTSTATYDGATNTWTVNATAGAGGTWGCGLVVKNKNALVPYGKSYVLSFEIKVPRACSWNCDVNNYALTGSSWSGNDNDYTSKRTTSSKSLVANQWIKCWVKWENTNSNNTNKVDIYDNSNFGVVMKDETSNMTYQIRNVKGELGNMPTEWTPAPEDINADINKKANSVDVYTKAETYTKGETDSAIKVAKESIELGVKTTYETKTNVESKISSANTTTLNSAKSYADTKKTEAITQAGKDADSKVATAKSDLQKNINLKASKTDVYTKAETYTKEETNSKINIAKEEINLGVKNTYETKTNVESKISTAVSNIQIGGRNLATSTNQGTTGWNWGLQTGGKTISEVTENGIRCCKMVRDNVASTGWSYISYSRIGRDKYLPNKQYTVSFEVKSSVATDFWCSLKEGNSSNPLNVSDAKATVSKANTWTKLSFTLTTKDTLPTSTTQGVYLSSMNSGTGVTYIFRNLMIEEGTKASSWTPAPEDVDSAIDTKASKTDVYKKTEVYTRAETNSQIKVAKDEINLGVKNTYETKTNVETKVNNAVTGLKVGGSNVLRNGNFAYDMTNWSVHDMNSGGSGKSVTVNSGGNWIPSGKKALQIKGTNTTDRYGVISSTMKLIPNTKYTISGYCSGHRVNKIQVNVRDRQGSDANIHTININPVSGGSTLDKWYRFETTFTTTSNTDFALNLYSVNFADNGYVWFCDVQIQQGTKATAWTPCSEDVDSAISKKANSTDVYTKSQVYTKEETNSQIKVAKDEINLGVKNTYETKTNVESKISTAKTEVVNTSKNYADTKKQEAISTASTDATNKVNSAKNELNTAINKKANSADVYKKTEVYTKTETDSKINVAKNDITLAVSNTYETKTNVETKVNNAVNNVQIGGRNLALSTGKATGDVSSGTGGSPYSATDLFSGITAIKTNTAWTGRYFNLKAIAQRGGFKAGDNLVLSVYIKADQNVTLNVTSHRTKGTGNNAGSSKSYTNFTVTPKWQQVWFPFVADEGSLNRTDTRIEVNIATGNNYIHWAGWKLEKGTKPSDWTPAPEDVDSAISSKANSTDVYTKSQVYTKEETNSQIKVAKDNITSTVSQNYLSKSDATNTYATKSSLTQTTNSITAKFEGSGGYNLLKNSGFKNGNTYWGIQKHNNPTNGLFEHILHSATWGYPDASVEAAQIRLSNQSGIEYGISQSFNTTIGKQYTLSFQYAGHRVSGANAIIRGANGSWLAHKYFTPTDYNGGNGSVNKWGTYSLTFTATATSHTLNIVINSAQNDGYLWIAKPQIVEGTVALPYSPHPSEIYEGSTIIDATGVTINNGALRVKNKAGTTVLSGDSNGNLMLTGTIKSEAGNGQYVTLNSGGITFRDSQKSEEVLRLNTSSSTSNRDINGVTFAMPQYADYLSFRHIAKPSLENGWDGSSVAQYSFMDMWSTDFTDKNGNKQYKGVNVYAPMYVSQKIRFRNGGDQYLHEVAPNIIWNNMNKLMGVYGDNGTVIGYKSGDNLQARIVVTEQNHPNTADAIRSWGHWNCSGAIVHNATFRGAFQNSYTNTATRTVTETAGVMAEGNQVRVNFEDVQIKDGKAILSIPRRYRGINDGYIVSSIVKKGRGDVWVTQEESERFIIEGENDILINVEIIIKLTEVAVAKTLKEEDPICFEVPNEEQPSNTFL